MEAKHTPGPWINHGSTGIILANDGHSVLNSYQVAEVFKKDDARLIAAAPDMLDALKKLLAEANGIAEMARPSIGNTNVACLLTRCADAHSAIAKATGAA